MDDNATEVSSIEDAWTVLDGLARILLSIPHSGDPPPSPSFYVAQAVAFGMALGNVAPLWTKEMLGYLFDPDEDISDPRTSQFVASIIEDIDPLPREGRVT